MYHIKKIKIFILLSFLCLMEVKAQGLIQGLSYKHDFQKDIDNMKYLHNLNQLNQQARIMKVQQLSLQYKELYLENYKNIPEKLSNGWYKVIVTNNYDFIEMIRSPVKDNRLIFDSKASELSNELSKYITKELKKGKIKFFLNEYIYEMYFIEKELETIEESSEEELEKESEFEFATVGEARIFIRESKRPGAEFEAEELAAALKKIQETRVLRKEKIKKN